MIPPDPMPRTDAQLRAARAEIDELRLYLANRDQGFCTAETFVQLSNPDTPLSYGAVHCRRLTHDQSAPADAPVQHWGYFAGAGPWERLTWHAFGPAAPR